MQHAGVDVVRCVQQPDTCCVVRPASPVLQSASLGSCLRKHQQLGVLGTSTSTHGKLPLPCHGSRCCTGTLEGTACKLYTQSRKQCPLSTGPLHTYLPGAIAADFPPGHCCKNPSQDCSHNAMLVLLPQQHSHHTCCGCLFWPAAISSLLLALLFGSTACKPHTPSPPAAAAAAANASLSVSPCNACKALQLRLPKGNAIVAAAPAVAVVACDRSAQPSRLLLTPAAAPAKYAAADLLGQCGNSCSSPHCCCGSAFACCWH